MKTKTKAKLLSLPEYQGSNSLQTVIAHTKLLQLIPRQKADFDTLSDVSEASNC